MVFPQAEFEIIPDSQAASLIEGSTSACTANPKNPDVTDVLRLLSLETTDDTQSVDLTTIDDSTTQTLRLPDEFDDDDWGLDNNATDLDINNIIYEGCNSDDILRLQASSIPIDTQTIPSEASDADLRAQVYGTISAFSARSLSTTIATLPLPPTVYTAMTPESCTGPPSAPKKPTRVSQRRATQDQQPEAVLGTDNSQARGPGQTSEVCLMLVILVHPGMNSFLKFTHHRLNLPSTNMGRVLAGVVKGHGVVRLAPAGGDLTKTY